MLVQWHISLGFLSLPGKCVGNLKRAGMTPSHAREDRGIVAGERVNADLSPAGGRQFRVRTVAVGRQQDTPGTNGHAVEQVASRDVVFDFDFFVARLYLSYDRLYDAAPPVK